MKRVWLPCLLVLLAVSVLGCSRAEEQQSSSSDNEEPVTLTFGGFQGGYDKAAFEKYVKAAVESKFSHIRMEYVDVPNGTTVEDLVASGSFPDIFNSGAPILFDFVKLGIPEDLTALTNTNNVNMNQYERVAVDLIKNYGMKDQMPALPYNINFYVTLYNKDIFDKFGVPYPKDGMSWEEVMELAKKLTRTEGGIQYKGVLPGNVSLMARGLSLAYVDSSTGKARIATDDWKKVFELAGAMYAIPGNMPKNPTQLANLDEFFKDKTLAMLPFYGNYIKTIAELGEHVGFNWDMTSYPSFTQGFSNEPGVNVLGISTASKNKKEAFRVIHYLTTSPEVQYELAKRGDMPAIKLDNAASLFGQYYPVLKQKNIQGIFKVQTRNAHPYHENERIVVRHVDRIFTNDFIQGKLDVNSALRKIEEDANKAIAEQMGQ